ncbi:putative selenate reductase subunit YgfK [Sporomusa acidovorans]|uniref:Oxidoreductase YgfK n=1 Tax=Sporomusa acidovorans (strain ATCC 49682 / DSM 3132 / Mol) TaxID=1123286 RepID=A0ABZ3J5R4_SPOA4|nr:putative selenate reductase subunit YgfK [Sporomusa acidovorans]OZC15680.1 NADPH-Fe(3+) oxidoreductase subunit beta [Sporomusa acidovorans DSM 3132]SDE88786.1 putative selenate reductase [Sporomusa acidovorans]
MGDLMRPVPLRELIARVFEEYAADHAIFGYLASHFFHKQSDQTFSLFGETIETAVGPAAGPHTQLAQNILVSYLAGARFIELKTVQEHEPPVAKPCIDADDEGFNTEWSSEYSVEKAYEEYSKAWVLLHVVEETLGLSKSGKRSFIFNMSAGYNLEGISSPRMDAYLNNMMDATQHPYFKRCLNEVEELIADGSFLKGTGLEARLPMLTGLSRRISGNICQSMTLSTMHGCPPAEIERICVYLLTEKKMNLYVKLNPTLLTYQGVRSILDSTGFHYVQLSEEAFDHDLQYADAIPMLTRLKKLADGQGRFFGVKLTNTLGSVNFKRKLPGDEMYMSGRALFPLSINLAAKISAEFDGQMPISFSGGITGHNVLDVFATGIKPVTMATELLKPGGYARMAAIAAKLETADGWECDKIDVVKLQTLAKKALTADYSQKDFRGYAKAAVKAPLPLFDCAAAPCKTACPIHQDIPEYIRLVGQKRYAAALALIYEKNALPGITGTICDHACQYHCTRLDYEGCVQIREVKRLAVEQGWDEFSKNYCLPQNKNGIKVAVMGAGPAGLAAAYFLARQGFSVTVFETRESAGGTVRYVIPHFRISRETIDSDINFIKEHGVEFVFNSSPELTPAELKKQGYKYVIVAVGAGAEKPFELKAAGGKPQIMPALKFLEQFNKDASALNLGKTVVTIGAGNTAMDVSRTALRVKGVETSAVVYRRSINEMPADQAEYKLAVAERVGFNFLVSPEKIDNQGNLVCQVMRLGQPDASGRRRPEPTGQVQTFAADTIIIAIGEEINTGLLAKLGITTQGEQATNLDNVYLAGDARQGASSIVKCIADGRRAADAICQQELPGFEVTAAKTGKAASKQAEEILGKKFGLTMASKLTGEGVAKVEAATGGREAGRCLECNYVCNKCIEVCPNRANLAVHINQGFVNYNQIIHLDAFCNECGNCANFCPWEGRPFTDKVTVFSRRDDFEHSQNNGFFVDGNTVLVRTNGKVFAHDLANGRLAATGNDAFDQMARVFNCLYTNRPVLFGRVEE